MKTESDNKGKSKDWNKTRKILSIIVIVLLAIVAFRKWSRGEENGNAELIGGADKPTVAVLLPGTEPSNTETVQAPALAEPDEAQAADDTPVQPATPDWCGLSADDTPSLSINGQYTTKDDVALYIHLYGHLPDNFITKAEARKLGWGDKYSSVDDAAPGKSIGGDRFGNREGLLPKKAGRTYTECDIDTMGKKSRGAKRIVFSNDGLIYYTGDHYETFELLYGSE